MEEDDQFTHMMTLEEEGTAEEMLSKLIELFLRWLVS